MKRGLGTIALASLILVLAAARLASAAPTEEDVLKSINENVGEQPDYGRFLALAALSAGIVAAIIVFRQYQKREDNPRVVNNPHKLLRQMARDLNIAPLELRKLKIHADEVGVEHPLTLLLCPSLRKPETKDASSDSNAISDGE